MASALCTTLRNVDMQYIPVNKLKIIQGKLCSDKTIGHQKQRNKRWDAEETLLRQKCDQECPTESNASQFFQGSCFLCNGLLPFESMLS